jgi:hypothetical protein
VDRHNQGTERHRLSPETIQVEMHQSVRRLALPGEPGESVKACIRRVSRRTGLGFDQIRRLWYLRWRVVPAHVADKIREAVHAHEKRLDQEWGTLKARYYALANHSSDEEFYRVRVDETCPPADQSD